MAALVLSSLGSAAGSAVFGPAGAIVGRLAGALAGRAVDQALFGNRRDRVLEGPRLADLDVMASTEGAPIPRVYGRSRIWGQVIWATQLQEVVNTTTTDTSGGKGGSRSSTTATTYRISPISRSASARDRSAPYCGCGRTASRSIFPA